MRTGGVHGKHCNLPIDLYPAVLLPAHVFCSCRSAPGTCFPHPATFRPPTPASRFLLLAPRHTSSTPYFHPLLPAYHPSPLILHLTFFR